MFMSVMIDVTNVQVIWITVATSVNQAGGVAVGAEAFGPTKDGGSRSDLPKPEY